MVNKFLVRCATICMVTLMALTPVNVSAETLLKRGSKGSEVVTVQTDLKKLGYYTYSKTTGFYGSITVAAVKHFQRDNGIAADGVIGKKTRNKLNAMTDSKSEANSEVKLAANPEVKLAANPEVKLAANPEVKLATNPEVKLASNPEVKLVANAEVKLVENTEVNLAAITQVNLEADIATNAELISRANTEVNSTVSAEVNSTVNTEVNSAVNTEVNSTVNTEVNSAVNIEVNSITNTEVNSNTNLGATSEVKPEVKAAYVENVQAVSGAEIMAIINNSSEYIGALDWFKEVRTIWDRGKNAIVTDVETGLSFHVKRTYGTNHADVETLSKEDTVIVKKIWGGFSWERRAVVVQIGNYMIAASMTAMPHAGLDSKPADQYVSGRSDGYGWGINLDKIKNNGCSGVMDIHFKNSRTHTTNVMLKSQQDMVKKAAVYIASIS